MLKRRVVGCLVVREGIVVQSLGFERYLPVGRPPIAVEFLDAWGIDEIVLLDISATREGRGPDAGMIRELSKRCHVPLTVGGGIRSIAQIHELLASGADKVVVNHAALQDPELVTEGARVFGMQCIVVAIDVVLDHGTHLVFHHVSRSALSRPALDWAREAERRGAGELFVNAVHRDGGYQGFDLDLCREISAGVGIPVIACGGAGSPEHFRELFDTTGVAAGAAANYFHFSEHSVVTTKAVLLRRGLDIRLDTAARYHDSSIDSRNRLEKRDDTYLEHLLFTRIEPEVV